MTTSEAGYKIRSALEQGLDELSAENLICGRLTREFVRWARRRGEKQRDLIPDYPGAIRLDVDMYIADEANDLLEAGRVLLKEGKFLHEVLKEARQ